MELFHPNIFMESFFEKHGYSSDRGNNKRYEEMAGDPYMWGAIPAPPASADTRAHRFAQAMNTTHQQPIPNCNGGSKCKHKHATVESISDESSPVRNASPATSVTTMFGGAEEGATPSTSNTERTREMRAGSGQPKEMSERAKGKRPKQSHVTPAIDAKSGASTKKANKLPDRTFYHVRPTESMGEKPQDIVEQIQLLWNAIDRLDNQADPQTVYYQDLLDDLERINSKKQEKTSHETDDFKQVWNVLLHLASGMAELKTEVEKLRLARTTSWTPAASAPFDPYQPFFDYAQHYGPQASRADLHPARRDVPLTSGWHPLTPDESANWSRKPEFHFTRTDGARSADPIYRHDPAAVDAAQGFRGVPGFINNSASPNPTAFGRDLRSTPVRAYLPPRAPSRHSGSRSERSRRRKHHPRLLGIDELI